MLRIKVWTLSLGCFLAISFSLCVLGGVLLPGLPIKHVILEALLPGFVWISPGAFVLGLAESFLFGAYTGLLFAMLHNMFASRLDVRRPGGAPITRVD